MGILMDELSVDFKFTEFPNSDKLVIEVNKQKFIRHYSVYGLGRGIDIHRERARKLGETLVEIGREIERQAEHGTEVEKKNANGLVAHFF